MYWQVGTSATIGTSTTFRGNIIADTSVTFTTSASTTGRVFALDGAATIDSTSIDAVPTGIEFSASSYLVGEGDPERRPSRSLVPGTPPPPASVRFTTSDTAGALNCNVVSGNVASSRCDYEIRIKTIRFAAGETSKMSRSSSSTTRTWKALRVFYGYVSATQPALLWVRNQPQP